MARYLFNVQTVRQAGAGQQRVASDPPPNPPSTPLPPTAGDAPPEVAAVYTAEQLQQAVQEQVRDIEIHAHLDLRNLSMLPSPTPAIFEGDYQLGYMGSTRSIRVRPLP